MKIEDYKKEICRMVGEICNFDFIVQIYSWTLYLYRRTKGS